MEHLIVIAILMSALIISGTISIAANRICKTIKETT